MSRQFAAKKKPLWLVLAGLFLGFAVWFVAQHSARKSSESLPFRMAANRKPAPLSAGRRGRMVYEKYGCAMCHGLSGRKGIQNPNSQTGLIPGVIYVKEGYTSAELRNRILKGVTYLPPKDPRKPPPPFRMPGWEGWMTEPEVNDLCEYLFGLMPKEAEEEW